MMASQQRPKACKNNGLGHFSGGRFALVEGLRLRKKGSHAAWRLFAVSPDYSHAAWRSFFVSPDYSHAAWRLFLSLPLLSFPRLAFSSSLPPLLPFLDLVCLDLVRPAGSLAGRPALPPSPHCLQHTPTRRLPNLHRHPTPSPSLLSASAGFYMCCVFLDVFDFYHYFFWRCLTMA